METKYKIGDKVRIKSLEWYNSNKDEYGNIVRAAFLKEMSECCGKDFEVSYASPFGGYLLEEMECVWYDWMFENTSVVQ